MTEEKPVLVKVEDAICWISLNRPDKLNSMTLEMHEMVRGALDEVEADDSIGCVVITGVGRAFCAGADVSHLAKFSPEEGREFSEKGQETIIKILKCPKPVVAAVNGYALGGGCELAMACDFRIASDKARFGQPEISLGLVPGWGATQLLQRIVGPAKAMELITTGSILRAEEAQQAGLVNKVAVADKFEEEVKAFAGTLASGPKSAVMSAKKLINLGHGLCEGLEKEAEAFGNLFATEDFKEGTSAFLEKRKPSFKGK
jgi:enoyl-CoA hydratase/carnithine racemase